jgi:hypothetical protein
LHARGDVGHCRCGSLGRRLEVRELRRDCLGCVGCALRPGGWHWKGCAAMTGTRTCSIHIDAPPSAAFALMRDPACYDEFTRLSRGSWKLRWWSPA